MTRITRVLVVLSLGSPLSAQSAKETDGSHQGAVVSAVQSARLERVGERRVAAHVAGTAPTWPERYNAVVPLVTPWVYQM